MANNEDYEDTLEHNNNEDIEDTFEHNKHFLCYVAHSENLEQLKAFIYEIDAEQYDLLSELAHNLIEGVIELKEDTSFLDDNLDFFQELSDKKLTYECMEDNVLLIADLVRLGLGHYALSKLNKVETSE